jgi:hypothetical protein
VLFNSNKKFHLSPWEMKMDYVSEFLERDEVTGESRK